MRGNIYPMGLAFLAAALYASGMPFAKLLLSYVPPMMMAALLYLGAGAGMLIFGMLRQGSGFWGRDSRFTRREMPFVIAMIILDIFAPVFLMLGLEKASAADASLLNNFEIVATSLVALLVFKEPIRLKLWAAIICITFASMMLAYQGHAGLSFSSGSLLILLACTCWGVENNFTRVLSGRDPAMIVVLKGLGAGVVTLLIALFQDERTHIAAILPALALGFVTYGLSIYCYVYAQRFLGAAKTSAYYAVAPFLGVVFSWILYREKPGTLFAGSLFLMLMGAALATMDQWKGSASKHCGKAE